MPSSRERTKKLAEQLALGFDKRPLPYRTELKQVNEEEIKRLNQEQGRTGVSKFLPAEEHIDVLLHTTKPSREKLLTAIQHPDERVLMALLKYEHQYNLRNVITEDGKRPQEKGRYILLREGERGEDYKRLSDLLTQRVLGDLEREGLLWNPLIDKMDAVQPDAGSRQVYQKRSRRGRVVTPTPNFFGHHAVRDVNLEKLREWVEREDDSNRLHGMLEFESSQVRSIITWQVPHHYGPALCSAILQDRIKPQDLPAWIAQASPEALASLTRDHYQPIVKFIDDPQERPYAWKVINLLQLPPVHKDVETMRFLIDHPNVTPMNLRDLHTKVADEVVDPLFKRLAEQLPYVAERILADGERLEGYVDPKSLVPLMRAERDEKIRRLARMWLPRLSDSWNARSEGDQEPRRRAI